MTFSLVTLAVIFGLMLAEARVSNRHEALLRTRGAIAPREPGYALMAIAYPAAFLAMGVEGAMRGDRPEGWFVAGALMFVVSKALKYWAIGALGERWSFRVLILPGTPLVADGPYRFVAHPNYVAVAGELVGTAMMMKAMVAGPIAMLLFGATLARRIRFETEALRGAYEKL